MGKTKPSTQARPPKPKTTKNLFEIKIPKKMGRPATKLEILQVNKTQFEYLMDIKPPLEWIADFYTMDADTICKFVKDQYGATFSEFRNKRITKWRVALFNATMDEAINKRTPSVLIFANKNLLKWQDTPPPDPEQQEDVELEFVDPNDKAE